VNDNGLHFNFSLSMSLGDRGREATLGNALSLSARFALSQMEAEQVIDEMKGYVGRWEEHCCAHAISPGDLEAIRACFMAGYPQN